LALSYGRIAKIVAQLSNGLVNSAMGQIRCSTERISSCNDFAFVDFTVVNVVAGYSILVDAVLSVNMSTTERVVFMEFNVNMSAWLSVINTNVMPSGLLSCYTQCYQFIHHFLMTASSRC